LLMCCSLLWAERWTAEWVSETGWTAVCPLWCHE